MHNKKYIFQEKEIQISHLVSVTDKLIDIVPPLGKLTGE